MGISVGEDKKHITNQAPPKICRNISWNIFLGFTWNLAKTSKCHIFDQTNSHDGVFILQFAS